MLLSYGKKNGIKGLHIQPETDIQFFVSGTVPGTLYKLSFNPYSKPMRMRWHYPYYIKKLAEV